MVWGREVKIYRLQIRPIAKWCGPMYGHSRSGKTWREQVPRLDGFWVRWGSGILCFEWRE